MSLLDFCFLIFSGVLTKWKRRWARTLSPEIPELEAHLIALGGPRGKPAFNPLVFQVWSPFLVMAPKGDHLLFLGIGVLFKFFGRKIDGDSWFTW